MALRQLRYNDDEILRKKSREVDDKIRMILNENGEEVILTGEGEMAKCFCHEIDHLDGIVFIDKVIKWLS